MGIGDLLGGAVDFLTPDTGRSGQGMDLGNLFDSTLETIQNSAVGALGAVPSLLSSDRSWGEKLLLGGALVGGAALGAHEWHAARSVERDILEATTIRPAIPTISENAASVGLRPRFSPATTQGEKILADHPGLRARTVDIMGAPDYQQLAQHLTDTADANKIAATGAIVEVYARRLPVDPAGQLGAARADWAKFRTALDKGMFRSVTEENKQLKALWGSLAADPAAMSTADRESLLGFVRQFSDATRGVVEPDLSVSPTATLAAVDLTPAGVVVHIDAPVGWDVAGAVNQKVRSQRLKQFDLRALAPRAKENLKELYRKGRQNPQRYLDIGEDWYSSANTKLQELLPGVQAEMPWVDMNRLAAAVSLTSAATDWDVNVQLALDALRTAGSHPDVSSAQFQTWLSTPSAVPESKAAKFTKTLRSIHAEMQAKSDKITEDDARKVLQLGARSGSEVLASTQGPKQKNFFLNLLDPTDQHPVTVDRHQLDMYFGLATHSDFKALEGGGVLEPNYDVLADTLRHAFKDLQAEFPDLTAPHQVQGVVWQVWRAMKSEWNAKSNNWERGRGPFRLPEPDGSENMVYLALQGLPYAGEKDVFAGLSDRVAYVTGKVDGYGTAITPNGDGQVVGLVDPKMASTVRHLYPALPAGAGAVWAPGYPVKVDDLDSFLGQIENDVVGHEVERHPSLLGWNGTHPAQGNGTIVMLEHPEAAAIRGQFNVVDPGYSAVIDRPTMPTGYRSVSAGEFVRARKALGLSAESAKLRGATLWVADDGASGFAVKNGDVLGEFGTTPDDAFAAGGARRQIVDGVEREIEGDTGARTRNKVRLVAVKLTPTQAARFEETVAKLEANGAKIRTVYAPGTPPEGWRSVREHLFHDGAGFAVVRTADQELTSPHGFTAWVREADSPLLPKSNPHGSRLGQKVEPTPLPNGAVRYGPFAIGTADHLAGTEPFRISFPQGSQPLLAGDAANADGVRVDRLGGRYVIEAPDPADVTDASKAEALLERLGVEPKNIHVHVGKDMVQSGWADPKVLAKTSRTQFGFTVSGRSGFGTPDEALLDKHGWEVYTSWPDRGGAGKLHPAVVTEVDDVLGHFMSDPQRSAALKMKGRARVVFSNSLPAGIRTDAVGWSVTGRDGVIGILGPEFRTPAKGWAVSVGAQTGNQLNPNVPVGIVSILGHELGHHLDDAVMLSFPTKGAAQQWRQDVIRPIIKSLRKKGVAKNVSHYANESMDEFMAEALVEAMYSDTPRRVARQVYTALMDQFKANTTSNSSFGWSRP